MFGFLSVLVLCGTLIYLTVFMQKNSMTFTFHHLNEDVPAPEKPLTEEEKKALDEQTQINDGLNEIIKFTQEFVGGETDDA